MPFANSVPSLFSVISGAPTPNVPEGFNIGASLGQMRTANNPTRQFMASLVHRIQEDQKNRVAKKLFESQGIKFPNQGIGSRLISGEQGVDPDTMKVLATLMENKAQDRLRNAQSD